MKKKLNNSIKLILLIILLILSYFLGFMGGKSYFELPASEFKSTLEICKKFPENFKNISESEVLAHQTGCSFYNFHLASNYFNLK